jgi:uncharacterized protein (TIGR02246 family)
MSQLKSNASASSGTSSAGTGIGDDQAIRQVMAEFVAAWNRHDPTQMASYWAQDGDLINPFGRPAKGRLQVEQLFAEEQGGAMKRSTHQMTVTSARILPGDVAIVDGDCNITGMAGPDGKEMPAFNPHLFMVLGKRDGNWKVLAARPYAFVPQPGPRQ